MTDLIGRVVLSKAGRDKGRLFIVVRMDCKEDYCYISDGSLRKIDSAKLKKIKHLEIKDIVADEIKVRLEEKTPVTNSAIRKFFAKLDI